MLKMQAADEPGVEYGHVERDEPEGALAGKGMVSGPLPGWPTTAPPFMTIWEPHAAAATAPE